MPKLHPTALSPSKLSQDEQTAYGELSQLAYDRLTPDQRKRRDGFKSRLSSVQPSVRVAAVRYLLSYAAGKSPKKALAEIGIDWSPILQMKWASPEYRDALEFIRRERLDILALKGEAQLEAMLDGETDEKTGNVRAVMFALERLKRSDYADDRGRRVDGQTGGCPAQVVYNITLKCENGAGNQPTASVIDIK